MNRKLKLWNGRVYGILGWSRKDTDRLHLSVAAYSVADIRQLCKELGYPDPGAYEINIYWNKGCWGNDMGGVPVERGIWIANQPNGKPQRLLSKTRSQE